MPCNGSFLFLAIFLKFFHKYAPEGMISKSGPLARRHRWRRQAYTSRRHRFWCLGLGIDADVVVTWQAPWHRRSWRRGYWCRERRQDLWCRCGVLTQRPTFLPRPSSSSFSSLLGFFSPHFTLRHESAY